jgi:hypothetical protein
MVLLAVGATAVWMAVEQAKVQVRSSTVRDREESEARAAMPVCNNPELLAATNMYTICEAAKNKATVSLEDAISKEAWALVVRPIYDALTSTTGQVVYGVVAASLLVVILRYTLFALVVPSSSILPSGMNK